MAGASPFAERAKAKTAPLQRIGAQEGARLPHAGQGQGRGRAHATQRYTTTLTSLPGTTTIFLGVPVMNLARAASASTVAPMASWSASTGT